MRDGWGEERKQLNRVFSARSSTSHEKNLVIYDMVLELAAQLQSLKVTVRSFRGRLGIECEDRVPLDII